jgi:voltage-gated sodium channel
MRVALTAWRARLASRMDQPRLQQVLLLLILANAAILGLESYPAIAERWGRWLSLGDRLLLGVFTVEIAVRIIAHGRRFFRDPWSVFDFAVIAIALIPASGPFAVLRALRVLRVMRVISLVPSMRRVAAGLLAAIPGLGAVVGMIAVILYVFAVMATKLFGERFPDWFGTLGESTYTLFQVMTLESWSMGIVRPVMEVYPHAWIFFVLYILVSTFTMLNLFIAVVVNAMQNGRPDDEIADAAQGGAEGDLRREIAALRIEVRELGAAIRNRN